MKGGPSIAVMLGGGRPKKEAADDSDDYADDSELSLSETKARAEDAATAFADAAEAKDAKRIVKAFCALQTLCGHLDELEDAGEGESDTEEEAPKDEAAEE